MGRKKILFIATGGTFSSVKTPDGIKPGFGVQEMIDKFPEAQAFADITGVQLCHLDSTNVQPSDWTNFAGCVAENYDGYDGFVIGHGTDTMAYTAAGLSFALAGIDKPVVITGSVVSTDKPDSDAKENFSGSLISACDERISGVHVFFHGLIISGTQVRKAENEATKITSEAMPVFSSVNAPYVGWVKNGSLLLNPDFITQVKAQSAYNLLSEFSCDIAYVKMFPGLESNILKLFHNKKAVVIEAFGPGNIPFAYSHWLSEIENLVFLGVPVFISSLCPYGAVDMDLYEVGVKAQKIGAISCEDMTVEAVTAKLMWIAGNFPSLKGASFVDKFKENIAGEFYARSPS